MTTLVAGGAGYIGSHTVRELLAAGQSVVVYDNLSHGHAAAVADVPLVRGDLRDRDALSKAVRDHDVTAVIDFAADIEVGQSMADPHRFYSNNLSSVLTVVEVMREHHVTDLVFSSTAAVYGDAGSEPIPEDAPAAPQSVYGRSKWMAEQVLGDCAEAYGIRPIFLRYFTAAGAHPSGELGEAHTPETHLIPLIMQVLLEQRDRICIYGRDYDTPDGTCIRDYIHVSDLAQAHVQALQALTNGAAANRVYNLGNGAGFSVLEVIETAEAVAGRAVTVESAARRPGDPPRLVARSNRARRELDWNPVSSDLRTILETAWRWHRTHPNGYGSRRPQCTAPA